MGVILEGQVLKKGGLNCKHDKVLYIDNAFDGQAFWCDMPDCGRHERIPYSPGNRIRFPASALIRTPNPKYGGEEFYSFRADSNGEAKPLPRKFWEEVGK